MNVENGGKPARKPPAAPVTREDLPLVVEPVEAYLQWRRARGLEDSDWWPRKVRGALESSGLVKRKGG